MGTDHGSQSAGYGTSNILNTISQPRLNESISEENDKKTNQKLNVYASELEVRDKKIQSIKERRSVIESILSEKLNIIEEHIIGSYARNTMIESNDNDIDIMVVLDDRIYGDWIKQPNGPSNCLKAIKRIIDKDPRFKNSNVHIDRNAVTVEYGDFSIDIVPAFKNDKGGYKIPDTHENSSWERTNPRMFKKYVNATDRATNGQLSKIVKIVKGWNENNGKSLSSFHIECMVYNHFIIQPRSNVSSITNDVEAFFLELPKYLRGRCYEPVYGERVDSKLSSEQKDVAIKKARDARYRIRRAKKLRDEGKEDSGEYKKIFGESFHD